MELRKIVLALAAMGWLCVALLLGGCASAGEPAKTLKFDLGGGQALDLVLVPAGEFPMGSPDTERERQTCEEPVHNVRITKPFYMGKCEVTNAQYRAFRPGHHSQYLDGDKQPALWVSWHDADAFCRWLSKKTGRSVRLPTEAEWEYACRARTTTRFYTGDQARLKDSGPLMQAAWYGTNARGRTRDVGTKKPNAFGLYDMHGNAWEWCNDWYGADYYKTSPAADPPGPTKGRAKVLRGGSYRFWETYYCRSAHRYSYRPDARECTNGFRVAVGVGKGEPRPAPKVTQPWPERRRIVPPFAPANDRERDVAKTFGAPALFVPKTAAPTIDGVLDDAAWTKARPVSFRFTSGRAAPPEAPTTAKVLCDGRALYVAIDCSEPDMSQLNVAGTKRDDTVWHGDAVGIMLDPKHEQTLNACYNIAVNPAGVTRETRGYDVAWLPWRFDIAVGRNGMTQDRRAWDPKLQVGTRRSASGWTVELALPLSEIGLAPGKVPTVMGMNLIRQRPQRTTTERGRPRLGKLVPHAWPMDDPDRYRPAEETGWAATLSPYFHLPVRFGHAVLEAGTVKGAPPARLFERIAREDFRSGTRGRFTKGTVEPGGYMGVGNALRFKQKEGVTIFQVPLKGFRDVQILAILKAEGGRNIYWHTYGKIWGTHKCCARQVTTLTRDFVPLDPSFTYCDGAGRMKSSCEGLSDRYYAGLNKHLSWYGEPSIGRIYFAGPKQWAVAYARVGEMITQNPHCKPVYPEKDELPGWFFHPGGPYDILISDVVMFKGVDNQPPAKVTGVKCAVEGDTAKLSWKKSADNTLTIWYKVVAGEGEAAETVAEVAELSATLPLERVKGKKLFVHAVDFFENVSERSEPAEAR